MGLPPSPPLDVASRFVDHMDRRHQGQVPRVFATNLAALDASLLALADSLMPTRQEQAQQMEAIEAVKAMLRQVGQWVGLPGLVGQ